MRKYRIIKITTGKDEAYRVQYKLLWWWADLTHTEYQFGEAWRVTEQFSTLQAARDCINRMYKNKEVVEHHVV